MELAEIRVEAAGVLGVLPGPFARFASRYRIPWCLRQGEPAPLLLPVFFIPQMATQDHRWQLLYGVCSN